MRLWHYQLLPYLPDAHFKGQLRELVGIMHDWKDKGKTNHILINKVMEYPKEDLGGYFLEYQREYQMRGMRIKPTIEFEFFKFCNGSANKPPFDEWHNKEYLRVCMANLYEKHHFGIGKSRITDEEWETLCSGYKEITGESYKI